ncbi:lipopolysaccharide biosynthesis protein [uncultured Enterovirga sp.]|uniref:lipopolysaccharide biosynthesis protein n=1 Tax=uncultured Enterovirga sp. TaxID=2026352 RepID=UPI0035CB109E
MAARLVAILRDRSEAGLSRRFAVGAFAARVLNAGLGFVTQVLLARWMGERDYGIYSTAWTWLLVAGGILSLGLPLAASKLVPEYRERDDGPGLRGFLTGSRRLGAMPSLLGALAAVAFLSTSPGLLGPYWPVAAITLLVLPAYVLMDIQTGIARACGFAVLGLAADYLVRPALLLALVVGLWAVGEPGTAATVMVATGLAVLLTTAGQGIALQRRLARMAPAGPSRTDLRRWATVSWPLLGEVGFMLLLGATDILVMQLFVPPEEIAPYFAATKIVAIASFVSYGVSSTSAHRFATQVSRGDRDGMARLAGETVRWTFWPTLAVAATLSALAVPLLALFGPSFTAGAPIVAILAAGLVAGAVVGPADRALAMADHGRAAAFVYACAFLANLLLCLILTPVLGPVGAALGTSLAMAFKAALLFVAAKRRLGIRMTVIPRWRPA